MNISITNIHCSTADITVDGKKYVVCYWDQHRPPAGGLYPPREIVWVRDVETGKDYDMYRHHTPVAHLVPLFQAICDVNAKSFADTTSHE